MHSHLYVYNKHRSKSFWNNSFHHNHPSRIGMHLFIRKRQSKIYLDKETKFHLFKLTLDYMYIQMNTIFLLIVTQRDYTFQ